MKERSRRGCVLWGGLGVLLILLFLGAGLWFFLFSNTETADAPPPPVVYVFLLTPANGDEVEVGDYVLVSLDAFGLSPLLSAELFVNGQSLGMESGDPENAYWTWQPLSIGIHSLTARVTDTNGEVGQSQTVIVNVLTGDGLMQVPAVEGQTLEDIGAEFGISSSQMAGANPDIDPEQPLPDGASVQVPIGDGAAGNRSGQGGEEISIPLIFWEFTPLTPVDKSYCYTSAGDGNWARLPKNSFKFFSGSPMKYTQHEFIPKAGKSVIQMQCWGWQGGALKFLGEGETNFDIFNPPYELLISGQGFQLNGKPQIPLSGKPPETGGDGILPIPPPFDVRQTTDVAACADHNEHIGSGQWSYVNPVYESQCDSFINKPVLTHLALIWEWEPGLEWPTPEHGWSNEIDGYRIYEIDPFQSGEPKLMAEIGGLGRKQWFLPLVLGYRCYGVQAYSDDPLVEPSEIADNCP
jgi:hypothetical protein